MAVTDNLIAHIYAEAGDSAITDKRRSVTATGSGTATLTAIGQDQAWNLVSSAFTVGIPSKLVNRYATGTGVSFAIRYRINTFGDTGGYNRITGIMRNDATKTLNLSKEGAGVRSQWDTTKMAGLTGMNATGVVRTMVFVCYTNFSGGSTERIYTWVDLVSRSGTAADFTTAGLTHSTDDTMDRLYIDAPDTMNWDLLDFAYWDRELTDAEAAAVADDLRAQLPVGGASDTTPPAFSVAPVISAITQAAVDLDATIDETGDIHWVVVPQADPAPTITNIQAGQANGGGVAIAAGSSLAGTVLDTQITGLTAGTAYAVYLVARDDEATPNVQASATQVNFSTSAPGDSTPDAFSFTDQTGITLSTQVTSNTITVTGINVASSISITGGEMSINAGAFTSTSTTVSVNDTVQLRQTSSASNSTQTDVTLDIGGVTDIWSVTTLAGGGGGTLTSKPLSNLSNVPQSPTGVKVAAVNLADLTVAAANLSVNVDGSYQLSITDAGITPGTSYALLQVSSDNTICNVDIRVAT